MTRPLAFDTTMPTRAVILAAGTGSRLRLSADDVPKPLHLVAGKPLLVRVAQSLRRAGIREIVVVLGFRGEEIRERLLAQSDLLGPGGVSFEFVWNHDYLGKNGLSVLAARDYVDQPCVLSMADHFYSPALVRRLLGARVPDEVCVLGVDRDIPRCFDLDDATKVVLDGERITSIGKELPSYNALDTGVFRINRRLVESLARVADERGDCSLSDGVQAAGRQGLFWGADVGDARWIDVDTPEAAAYAEMLVMAFGEDLMGRDAGGQDASGTPAQLLQRLALSAARHRATISAGAEPAAVGA